MPQTFCISVQKLYRNFVAIVCEYLLRLINNTAFKTKKYSNRMMLMYMYMYLLHSHTYRLLLPQWQYLLACPLFHNTLKTSLHRLAGLCKDVFMFYETEPWYMYMYCRHMAMAIMYIDIIARHYSHAETLPELLAATSLLHRW